jgi:hypothetical protein
MYASSSMTNPGSFRAAPTLPSSNYANGHSNKKRRTTVSSSRPAAKSAPPPLPTPTSATHPPSAHPGAPSNSLNELSTDRVPSPATSLPPYSSPSMNGIPALPGTNNAHLPFSPNFAFSPLPQINNPLVPTQSHHPPPHPDLDNAFDPAVGMPHAYDQQPTPGTASTSGGSVHNSESDKDPFLSLLEQLAENEGNQGGPSELDFFLSGQSG